MSRSVQFYLVLTTPFLHLGAQLPAALLDPLLREHRGGEEVIL
jgi:hypothetical protein